MLFWIPILVFFFFILLFVVNIMKREYASKNKNSKQKLDSEIKELLEDIKPKD
jgi:preprotein translocase subunit SecG